MLATASYTSEQYVNHFFPQLYQSARLPEFPYLTSLYRWNYTKGGSIPDHSNIIPYRIPCHGMAISYHTIHTIPYTIPWYGHTMPYHSYHTTSFIPYHILPFHIPYHSYHIIYHTMVWPCHAIPFIPYGLHMDSINPPGLHLDSILKRPQATILLRIHVESTWTPHGVDP